MSEKERTNVHLWMQTMLDNGDKELTDFLNALLSDNRIEPIHAENIWSMWNLKIRGMAHLFSVIDIGSGFGEKFTLEDTIPGYNPPLNDRDEQ